MVTDGNYTYCGVAYNCQINVVHLKLITLYVNYTSIKKLNKKSQHISREIVQEKGWGTFPVYSAKSNPCSLNQSSPRQGNCDNSLEYENIHLFISHLFL